MGTDDDSKEAPIVKRDVITVELPKQRNPIAAVLRGGAFSKRIERNAKGKGAYRRQERNRGREV
jgi:hypothetical protein